MGVSKSEANEGAIVRQKAYLNTSKRHFRLKLLFFRIIINYDTILSQEEIAMKSLITEISEKVRIDVDQLSKSIDSLKCSDKIVRIEDTINGIKQQGKLLNSDNSANPSRFCTLLQLFQIVVKYLEEAKSALQPEKKGDYKQSIEDAFQFSHLIENL